MISQVILTPLEPYFFGDERTFSYPGVPQSNGNSYFIRSLDIPSQTTLFGALRYLGNRKKTFTGQYVGDDDAIGAVSYDLTDAGRIYGWIESISPLLLLSADGHYLVPAPLDHQVSESSYTPLTWSTTPRRVADGFGCPEKVLPRGYVTKKGLTSGWLDLTTGEVCTDIFYSDVRVGNKQVDGPLNDDGFFKRETKIPLKGSSEKPYAFTFFAELDDQFEFTEKVVYLGQRRSAFSVSYVLHAEAQRTSVEEDAVSRILGVDHSLPASLSYAYARSDVYLSGSLSDLGRCCSFMITKTRQHRGFWTTYQTNNQLDRFHKHDQLLRLIRAGSVFLINDLSGFQQATNNPHAQKAGFNHVLTTEG